MIKIGYLEKEKLNSLIAVHNIRIKILSRILNWKRKRIHAKLKQWIVKLKQEYLQFQISRLELEIKTKIKQNSQEIQSSKLN